MFVRSEQDRRLLTNELKSEKTVEQDKMLSLISRLSIVLVINYGKQLLIADNISLQPVLYLLHI